ncbi:hypothetical protein ILYODFUR_033813 [Ilyodon furcidens]|uniref:Uncharacterized protein n=1 Tax=Ilyodon furcidens TaxID=33524 RepID=A0ABV0VA74_9TELE
MSQTTRCKQQTILCDQPGYQLTGAQRTSQALVRASYGHLWDTAALSQPENFSPQSCVISLLLKKPRCENVQPQSGEMFAPGNHVHTTKNAFSILAGKISRELYDCLYQEDHLLTEAQHSHTQLLVEGLCRLLKTSRVCSSSVQIVIKQLSHAFSIVPTDQSGVTLAHAHYSPVGDHRGYKATLHIL